MARLVDIHQLRAFIAVAEELSFRRAAERLAVSQPPLSVRIKKLEEQLGVKLLDRDRNKRVELTPAGRMLLYHATGIMSRLEMAAKDTQRAAEGLAGNLLVGHTDDFFHDVLPNALLDFYFKFPEVFLTHEYGLSYTLLDLLMSEKLDIILIIEAFRTYDKHVESVELEPTEVVLALPKEHRLAGREVVELAELKDDVFLLLPEGTRSTFSEACTSLFEQAGFQPRRSIAGVSTGMQLQLVVAGIGALLCTRAALPAHPKDFSVVQLSDPNTRLKRVALYRTDNPNLRLIEKFIDVICRRDNAEESILRQPAGPKAEKSGAAPRLKRKITEISLGCASDVQPE